MRAALLLWIASVATAASPTDCAPCHPAQTAKFADSGMAKALFEVKNSKILLDSGHLLTKIDGFSYQIDASGLSVTDGKETLKVPIAWAFGNGAVGQTFLFQREGRWYESRVSYYSALKGLDLTIGTSTVATRNLLEAAGRLTSISEAAQCFSCHATGARAGIQCERCHTGNHGSMPKLGAMSTEETSEFCGQCHRTWSRIALNGPRGIQNIRFQPYRLALSKCYDAEDRRIRCTECHNPHRAVETAAASYDVRCGACHAAGACKVGSRDCVTCHMPKLELPGAHQKFTDHRIRIVRANEPYPD
jgi:hypothetical protein